MNEKCKKCRYKNRPKKYYPCDKCLQIGYMPLTCDCCRKYPCTNKKGIRPCKKFIWD